MGQRKFSPWRYKRGSMPHKKTLAKWRRTARELAQSRGATTSCDYCKRPVNQWGGLLLKHPKSMGRSRKRRICSACTDLLIHFLDIMEWKGASDHLPPESFNRYKGENHRRPEDVKDEELLSDEEMLLTEPMPGDGWGKEGS